MTDVETSPLTPSQQTVLLTLADHPMCTLARSTMPDLAIVGAAATYRLAIKRLVDVEFQTPAAAVLTENGKLLVEQIRQWHNARPVDVQALTSCAASSGGAVCGRCHVCGGKLRTMLALSCQRCGSSDADE